jgi:hypothetical protein
VEPTLGALATTELATPTHGDAAKKAPVGAAATAATAALTAAHKAGVREGYNAGFMQGIVLFGDFSDPSSF